MKTSVLKSALGATFIIASLIPLESKAALKTISKDVDGMRFSFVWDTEDECVDENATLVAVSPDEIAADLVIPSTVYYAEADEYIPVFRIAADAIKNCPNLRSVTFPETMYALRPYSISFCENLEEVTLHKNLNSIGTGNPFVAVPKLRTINVPEENRYFASYGGAVYTKDLFVLRLLPPGAENVPFSDSCVEIGQAALAGCADIEVVSLPAGVTAVGNYAFMDCRSLREFMMPETLLNVGAGMFENCTSLERVVMNSHCENVGIWMFLNCTSLKEVEIGENVTCVNSKAFAGCGSLGKIRLLPTVPPTFNGEEWFDEAIYSTCVLEVPAGTGEAYRNADVWKNFVRIEDPAERPAIDGMKAEYFIDVDPGIGKGEMLDAEIGINDWRLPIDGMESGAHIFGIRVVDSKGTFTATVTLPLYISDEKLYSELEYYVDEDPGLGKGVHPDHHGARTVTFDVAADGLTFGAHTLSVRVMDNVGKWSDVMTRPFIVTEGVAPEGDFIVEYFYDEDPGIGNATQVQASAGKNVFYLTVDATLEPGAHLFGVRCRDKEGNWTPTVVNPLYVMPSAEFSEVEYFVDNDPGEGNGNGVTVDGDGRSAFTVPTAAMDYGEHILVMRGQTSDGQWTELFRRAFNVTSDQSGVAGVEWGRGLRLALQSGQLTVHPGGFSEGTTVEVYTLDGLVLARMEWSAPEEPLTVSVGSHGRIIVRAVTPDGATFVNFILQ